MKLKNRLIAAATMMATAWTASANVVVLGPSDAANGPISNGSSPIDTTTSQHMIGSGSWQANGTAASQYYLYYNGSSATEDGLGQLTVSELTSLSLSTYLNNAVNGANAPDWYLTIYTAPHAGGEQSWYGNRLVMEPYLANGLNAPANQWNTFSTASGGNQLTVNDTGGLSGNLGYYGQPTLATIQSGSINWSTLGSPGGQNTSVDYADMDILGIVLSTGSGWANGFTGLVDDVNINTTQGNVQFDLEATAVPEASTVFAGALLLLPFGLSMLRILRRSRMA
jgi:hypothetical protein